jgi:Na+/H+ antiporter NhaD/arsenite permease-like protein
MACRAPASDRARRAGEASMHGGEAVHVWFGLNPLWVSTIVLIATYVAIMTERLNRAVIALLAAGIVVLVGLVSQHAAATKAIDWNTIGLLTGMMIIVAITRKSGVFQYVAIKSAQRVRASPAGIMVMLSLVTAVFSAFLDNVTTVLLVAPVTLAICKELELPPYPILFAEIFASNVGGTATLIGDPPNILIGSLAGLSFNDFAVNLTPVVVVALGIQIVATHLIWGRRMKTDPAHQARVMAMNANETITDPLLLKQSMVVLAAVIAAFITARIVHLEPATIAMLGAAALLMVDCYGHHPEKQSEKVVHAFNEVEWITIFFFAGLFIVVHAVDASGLLKMLADMLVKATGGNLEHTAFAILWASAVLSAIVDNIPFVATMIPLIKEMAPSFGGTQAILPLWWCLSLGACLGGNGTLIGASANLTVAGIAERNGVPFRFLTYVRHGFPMMLVSVAIAHVFVWLRYF